MRYETSLTRRSDSCINGVSTKAPINIMRSSRRVARVGEDANRQSASREVVFCWLEERVRGRFKKRSSRFPSLYQGPHAHHDSTGWQPRTLLACSLINARFIGTLIRFSVVSCCRLLSIDRPAGYSCRRHRTKRQKNGQPRRWDDEGVSSYPVKIRGHTQGAREWAGLCPPTSDWSAAPCLFSCWWVLFDLVNA